MLSQPALAQKLPDLPRWVEARSLLLANSALISGLQETPALSVVITDPEPPSLIVVVGQPDPQAILDSIPANQSGLALIAPYDQADWLTPLFPTWKRTRALLHSLQRPDRLPTPNQVRFLDPSSLPNFPIPADLLAELQDALNNGVPIAATYVNEQPVSFSYAGSTTETLWDISIDTLAEHRQKGYAALCVSFLIRHYQAQNLQPVWAAVEENPASWRLAQKIGFTHIDDLVLFEP